jgi:hypothetical protein
MSGLVVAIAALLTALVCSAGLGCIIRVRPGKMQPQGSVALTALVVLVVVGLQDVIGSAQEEAYNPLDPNVIIY